MGHGFVDQMLEKTRSGELRSPVSSTFGMNLVAFGRGEATYEMDARAELGNPLEVDRLRAEARVVRAGGRLVWAEADVLADGEMVGKFASTGIRVSFDAASYVGGQEAK